MLITLGSVLVSLAAAAVYITDLVRNEEVPCGKTAITSLCDDQYYTIVSPPP